MADPLLSCYQTYVRRIHNFLFLGGVLPSSAITPVASYCSALLTAGSCFGMSCAVINFCLYNIKDLNSLTKGISLACSLLATSLKATCFLVNRKSLIELHETLGDLFQRELTHNPRTRATLLSQIHTFDRPAYTFSFLVGATLTVYLLPPLMSLSQQYARTHAESKTYRLPFPAKFPWTIEGGGLFYQIHFLYETLVAWFLYFTNSGVDALFGFYIFQIASLLRGMTYELQNPRPNEGAATLLRACIEKHWKLLRCRDTLQTVYGPIILWLVLTNGVVMCGLIFQAFQDQFAHSFSMAFIIICTICKIRVTLDIWILTLTSVPSGLTRVLSLAKLTPNMTFGKAALFAFYMFLKLVQTFMYAWYGGVVTSESEMFRQGLYFSDWLEDDYKSLKAGLLVTMLQRPLTITALRFFNVSVDMFSKIINTTMSYFFLLQTLDESE